MDDKSFNLLEKIYVELQESKKELRAVIKSEINDLRIELKAEMQSNNNHIIKFIDDIHNKY